MSNIVLITGNSDPTLVLSASGVGAGSTTFFHNSGAEMGRPGELFPAVFLFAITDIVGVFTSLQVNLEWSPITPTGTPQFETIGTWAPLTNPTAYFPCSSTGQYRLNVTAFSGGTSFNVYCSIASSMPQGSGGGGGGSVTQGTIPWQENITQAAGVALAGQVAGSIPVTIVSGAGSGGTASADEAAFTEGVSSLTPIGGEFNSSSTNLTTGHTGIVRMTADRNFMVDIEKFGGTNIVTGTGASGAGIPRVTVSNDSTVILGTGAAVIGSVNQGTAAALTAGWPVTMGQTAESTAAWTSATAGNTALSLNVAGYSTIVATFHQTSTITGGVATFEVSDAGVTWYPIQVVSTNSLVVNAYTFQPNTDVAFQMNVSGFTQFRVRLSTVITGTGTVNVGIAAQAGATEWATIAFQGGAWLTTDNITQFGGAAVVTGTGASGAGIPRVTVSNDSALKVWDGTNIAAVKAASTAPVATDPAFVVSISPNTGALKIVGNSGAVLDGAVGAAASTAPANAVQVGAQFLTSPPTLTNGQLQALLLDASGNLKVNVVAGGGSGSNAAAGPTGSAVPADADYEGVNVGGTLRGVTGLSLNAGAVFAPTVAIVDGSGNQITSFGGGTQFADNAASGATPTGTLAMLWDSVNSKVRAAKADAGQNLLVAPGIVLASMTAITSANGTLGATFNVGTGFGVSAVLLQLDQTTTITAGAISFDVTYDGTNWVTIAATQVLDPTAIPNQISLPYTLQASTNKPFLIKLRGAQGLRLHVTTAVTGTGSITPNYALLSYDPEIAAIVYQGTSPWVENVSQFGGNAVVTGTGASGVGIPRVTVSNDSKFQLWDGTHTVSIDPNGDLNIDLQQVSGTAVNTAAAGTLLVGVADGAGNKLTTNSSTFTAKFALDVNILGSDGTAFGTAGILDDNLKQIGGTAVRSNQTTTAAGVLDVNNVGLLGTTIVTAAAGVQRIGIAGSANAVLDATVAAGSAPTNGIATLVQYNSTIPALTAAQTVAAQADTTGSNYVNNEGRKATYSCFASFTAAAGVIAVLPGSATKTVRITRVEVSISTSGTAALEQVSLIVTSAAPTGGTSGSMTAVKHDSNFGSATAAPLDYTAAPTAGTAVGTIRGVQFNDQSAALPGAATWLWTFGDGRGGASGIVLRGTAQTLEVNLGGVVATQTVTVSFEWTEE